jgi:twinkle protein
MRFNWEKHGIDISKARGGKMLCPKCSHTRKPENRTDKCLSVNKDSGLFNCHNCDFAGTAAEDEYLERQRERKVYVKPTPRLNDISDKMLSWFFTRGISSNTLAALKVTEEPQEWMPQVEANRRCICFNYYRNGELVNIKFRDSQKHFKLAKDAELIFYNLDAVKNSDKKFIIIVEGEMDAATWVECGFLKVISVPNGASKGSMKLEYLDNCYDDLKDVISFIIATDGDEAGEALRQELIRRLGAERCLVPIYPAGCKDTNEIYLKYQKQGVMDFFKSATPVPIKGVMELSDIKEDAERMYLYGYPETVRLDWGLDKYLRFRTGEFTVVTGIPNHGKSTWLNNVLVRLADKHGWIFAIYSPEKNPLTFLIAELAQIYIGVAYFRSNPEDKMSRAQWEQAMNFIDEHFLFLKTDDDLTLDQYLQINQQMVRRYGIKGVVGDPWNYFEHDRPVFQSETEYTGIQLGKVSKWCKRVNVHTFIVAHPTKMDKDKKTHTYLVPTLYNISGSAHWNNKVDNGVCVYRNYATGLTDIHIQKIRWFFVGTTGTVKMKFDTDSQRFVDYTDVSPEQQSYEDIKANKLMAERARDKLLPAQASVSFPGVPKEDLPF